MKTLEAITGEALRYYPKMVSARYGLDDKLSDIWRDGLSVKVKQDIARDLYEAGFTHAELVRKIKGAYKLVANDGTTAKYKLDKEATKWT